MNPAEMTPREAGAEALRRTPAMLARLREVRHLPESDARRVAALEDKQLVFALIAQSQQAGDEAVSE